MEEIQIVSTLDLLNTYLQKRGETRAFIICGGASLILQKIVSRATQDIDIVAPEIDKVLEEASKEVAHSLGLDENWLNSAPKRLVREFSPGWENRIIQVYQNSHLIVSSISREDMIFAKFYAYCDRQKDIYDLVDLAPTVGELEKAVELTKKMDANPDWPAYVDSQKSKLKKRLNRD